MKFISLFIALILINTCISFKIRNNMYSYIINNLINSNHNGEISNRGVSVNLNCHNNKGKSVINKNLFSNRYYNNIPKANDPIDNTSKKFFMRQYNPNTSNTTNLTRSNNSQTFIIAYNTLKYNYLKESEIKEISKLSDVRLKELKKYVIFDYLINKGNSYDHCSYKIIKSVNDYSPEGIDITDFICVNYWNSNVIFNRNNTSKINYLIYKTLSKLRDNDKFTNMSRFKQCYDIIEDIMCFSFKNSSLINRYNKSYTNSESSNVGISGIELNIDNCFYINSKCNINFIQFSKNNSNEDANNQEILKLIEFCEKNFSNIIDAKIKVSKLYHYENDFKNDKYSVLKQNKTHEFVDEEINLKKNKIMSSNKFINNIIDESRKSQKARERVSSNLKDNHSNYNSAIYEYKNIIVKDTCLLRHFNSNYNNCNSNQEIKSKINLLINSLSTVTTNNPTINDNKGKGNKQNNPKSSVNYNNIIIKYHTIPLNVFSLISSSFTKAFRLNKSVNITIPTKENSDKNKDNKDKATTLVINNISLSYPNTTDAYYKSQKNLFIDFLINLLFNNTLKQKSRNIIITSVSEFMDYIISIDKIYSDNVVRNSNQRLLIWYINKLNGVLYFYQQRNYLDEMFKKYNNYDLSRNLNFFVISMFNSGEIMNDKNVDKSENDNQERIDMYLKEYFDYLGKEFNDSIKKDYEVFEGLFTNFLSEFEKSNFNIEKSDSNTNMYDCLMKENR